MKLSFLCELLLILIIIAFAASKPLDSTNGTWQLIGTCVRAAWPPRVDLMILSIPIHLWHTSYMCVVCDGSSYWFSNKSIPMWNRWFFFFVLSFIVCCLDGRALKKKQSSLRQEPVAVAAVIPATTKAPAVASDDDEDVGDIVSFGKWQAESGRVVYVC